MTQTANLLLEIFSEEMPSGLQSRAVKDMAKTMADKLVDAKLTHAPIITYTTPRRLVFCINDLPLTQPDIRETKKGPRVNAPEQAINGFLRGAGLDCLESCEIITTPKGDFYQAVLEKKGRPTADVLSDIITHTIKGYTWAKSMRFADFDFRWVRPLRHILAVFNGQTINGAIPMSGDKNQRHFTNTTVGHRFMGNGGIITVTDFADYEQKLADNGVTVNHEKRRADIANQLNTHAETLGLTLVQDEGLLDEVTGLVEHVNTLVGKIDDDFMTVAQECIILSMREHQKYFSFKTKDGTLAPYFATIANMTPPDNGKQIISGNERVLRSRLSDAKFFWDNDCQTPLETMVEKLNKVVFHAKLGTVADRVTRMAKIADVITPHIPGANATNVQTAVALCKADLMSQMVYEFPELQGVMGQYYAKQQGKSHAVAHAIAEHYSPLGPNDTCPTAPVSVVVALAEKLDTLVGFWLIHEKPTGSKDPYALRRACLGVIRLILENGIELNLRDTLKQTAQIHGIGNGDDALDLVNFFVDRLKVYLKNQNIRHDVVQAVTVLGMNDLLDTTTKAKALQDFITSADGDALVQLYRRAGNIVTAEEKKDGIAYGTQDLNHTLGTDADTHLIQTLENQGINAIKHTTNKQYAKAMAELATLKPAVDTFFNDVKVNDDNPKIRANRLHILGALRNAMNKIADFSKISGE